MTRRIEDDDEDGRLRVRTGRNRFFSFNLGHLVTIVAFIIGGAMEWQHQTDEREKLGVAMSALEQRIPRLEANEETTQQLEQSMAAVSTQISDLKQQIAQELLDLKNGVRDLRENRKSSN